MSCESVYPTSTLNLAAKSIRESTMYDSSIANLEPPKRMFFFGDPLIVAGGGGRNCGGDKRLSNASRGEKGHPSGRIKNRVEVGFGGESDREFCGGAGIKGNGHVGLTGLTPAMNFYDGFDGGWSELNKKLYFACQNADQVDPLILKIKVEELIRNGATNDYLEGFLF